MSRRFANQLQRIKPSLQARIDYSHFAAPNLMCCPFNELAGPVRNLCTWQQAETIVGTAPVWTGSHLQFSGGYASFGDVNWFDGLAAFTIMLRARPANLIQTAGLLNKRNSFSENTDVCLTLANPNALTCITGGVAPNICNYSFDVSGWVGFETMFITFDSAASAGNRWKCWRGVTALTPTVGADVATVVPNTTYPLVIGAINTASPLYVAAGIDYIYAWSGVQPLSVRDAILDDAFCFLDDGPRRVYFVPPVTVTPHALSGYVGGRSRAYALPTVQKALSGVVTGRSRAVAAPTVSKLLTGRVAGRSRATAQALVAKALSGFVQGRSRARGYILEPVADVTIPAHRLFLVAAEQRIFEVSAVGCKAEIPVAYPDPDSNLWWGVDWSARLPAGVTIASSIWLVPTGLNKVDEQLATPIAKVRLTVTGAVGSDYRVVNRVTYSTGEVDDQTVIMIVRDN